MFGATYRTLDIRSAAVKQGDKWANVYAVIRLTYEQPAVAAERLRRLERDHGAVRTESFRILLGLRPFSELGEFWEDLALGRLCVGGEEITTPRFARSIRAGGQLPTTGSFLTVPAC